MRIRLTTGRTALTGAMLAVALLVLLPLRLAVGWLGLDAAGLSARQVSGTVWGGSLDEARFGDLVLGDVSASLSPWPLLLGRARIALAGAAPVADAGTGAVGDGGVPGRALAGVLQVGRHSLAVDALTATLPTGRIFAPLPVTAIDLDAVTVRFEDGTCAEAEGRVRATLVGTAGGVALPPSLAGTARCDKGALLLPLVSQAGTESAALRLTPDGHYSAELVVRPTDPTTARRLELAGFVAGPAGHRLSIEGRL